MHFLQTPGAEQKTDGKFLATEINMNTVGKEKESDKLRYYKIAQDPCLSGASVISFM